MTPRTRQTAIRSLAVIIATTRCATVVCAEGKRPDKAGRRCPRATEGYRRVASDGYRQERTDFQEGLYESDRSCVRQTG
jgi:hypothetical protein